MAIFLKKSTDEDVEIWIWKKHYSQSEVALLDTIFSYSTILYHADFYSQ